ncbi:MAG: twin-arginine translocation signal domain-containing protein [Thaumarchaeota archaeon]|nr:twin-arginine translocation signal domain-containing protein [Nitrososphaerota archaeon]
MLSRRDFLKALGVGEYPFKILRGTVSGLNSLGHA